MKKLLLLFFISIFYLSVSAQISEKWNSLYNRYDYTDSQGNLVAYKGYNSLTQAWETYQVEQQNTAQNYEYVQPTNLKLLAEVMSAKQDRFDNNAQRIDNYIVNTRNLLNSSGLDSNLIQKIKDRANSEYIDIFRRSRYDLSSNSKTNEVLDWLSRGVQKIINEEVYNFEIEKQKRTQLTNQLIAEMAYGAGGYTTTDVTDERYNAVIKAYTVVSRDNSLSKLFLESNQGFLSFFRQKNKIWRHYTWRYFHADDKSHTLIDETNGALIEIGVRFDWAIIYEEKIGDTYAYRYVYRNLKKDNTVDPRK